MNDPALTADLLIILAWCTILTSLVAVGIWVLWVCLVLPVAKIWELIARWGVTR